MSARDDLLDTIVRYADDYANHVIYRETTFLDVEAALAKYVREVHRLGYERARQDMISGAFIGGPTYEALRDSFTGKKIAEEAVDKAFRDAGY